MTSSLDMSSDRSHISSILDDTILELLDFFLCKIRVAKIARSVGELQSIEGGGFVELVF